jgi:hypothetical protein
MAGQLATQRHMTPREVGLAANATIAHASITEHIVVFSTTAETITSNRYALIEQPRVALSPTTNTRQAHARVEE